MANLLSILRRRSDEIARLSQQDYLAQLAAAPFYPNQSTLYSVGRRPVESVPNSYLGYAQAAYASCTVVGACMRVRRDIFSQARFTWRELTDDGTGTLSHDDELALLDQPWPNGTTGQLLTKMITDVDLCGNAYIVNEGDRLRWRRPDWMFVVLSGDPNVDDAVDVLGYVYTPGGCGLADGRAYTVEEVAHWAPTPLPGSEYIGMSWMTSALREIQADKHATEHKLNFFVNGASLGPVFTLPATMNAEQFRKFRVANEEAHVGVENAYKPLYIGGGAGVTLSAATFQQLELKATQGAGEPLALDTPVPTPTGWTTMGALAVGDQVLGRDGRPARVVGVSPVHHGRECFRISLKDRTAIVADASHLWAAVDRNGNRREGIYTTQELYDLFVRPYHNGVGGHRLFLPGSPVVELKPVDLLVDPYVLGAWLGDGQTAGAAICGAEEDLAFIGAEIEARGYTTNRWATKPPKVPVLGLPGGLLMALRALGVLGNKHIPATYLRSSVDQRLDLLRGLMDTDGSVTNERGSCEYSSKYEHLASQVAELLRSLGYRTTMFWCDEPRSRTGRSWRVHFRVQQDRIPFLLPRKVRRCVKAGHPHVGDRRSVVSIERVDSVPVRCIAVDTPDHLFLAGEGFVPTHNTRIAANAGIHPTIAALSEGLQGSSLNAGNFTAARRLVADITLHKLWQDACDTLASFLQVPDGKELWIRERAIPFLREDAKDAAEIFAVDAQSATVLVREGYEPETVTPAVAQRNILLLQHSGALSVQLQEPGAEPEQRSQVIDGEVVVRAIEAELTRRFNPSQPRDTHGRWTLTGAAIAALKALGGEPGAVNFDPDDPEGRYFDWSVHDPKAGTYSFEAGADGESVQLDLTEEDLTHLYTALSVTHLREDSSQQHPPAVAALLAGGKQEAVSFSDGGYADWSVRDANGFYQFEIGDGNESVQMDLTSAELARLMASLALSTQPDEATRALIWALDEITRADWNPAEHPRNPRGGPGGGRFRSVAARILDALEAWAHGDGDDESVLADFTQPQLRKAVQARGLTPKPRGSAKDLRKQLLDDVREKIKGRKDGGLPEAATPKVSAGRLDLAELRKLDDPEAIRDALDLHKVPELKQALRDQKLPLSGRKRELVDRLVEHLLSTGGPSGLSSDPDVRAVQVENKIRAAYRDAATSSGRQQLIPLADIRERLTGLDRAEVDAALTRMARGGTASLTPNEDRKRRTQRDRGAALRIPGYGSEDANDWVTISDPSPRPLPRSKKDDKALPHFGESMTPDQARQRDQEIVDSARAELARLEDTRGLSPQQAGDRMMLANRERARLAGAQARIAAAQPQPTDPQELANWRFAQVEAVRDVAESLSMLDELTYNEASAAAVQSRLRSGGYGVRPELVAELTEAGMTRDPAKVAAAIDRVEAAHGLTRIGNAGATATFDPTRHEVIGDRPGPGERVEVIAPGYSVTLSNGETVQLSKAKVSTYDPAIHGEASLRGPSALAAARPKRAPTETESAALRRYGGDGGYVINNDLRASEGQTERLTPRNRASVEALDALMGDSPLPSEVVVHRKLSLARNPFSTSTGGEVDPLDRDLTGFSWTEPAYSSTSVGTGQLRDREISLRITVPASTPALSHTEFDNDEIVLPHGLTFRVTADHGKDDRFVRHLDVEVVPVSTYDPKLHGSEQGLASNPKARGAAFRTLARDRRWGTTFAEGTSSQSAAALESGENPWDVADRLRNQGRALEIRGTQGQLTDYDMTGVLSHSQSGRDAAAKSDARALQKLADELERQAGPRPDPSALERMRAEHRRERIARLRADLATNPDDPSSGFKQDLLADLLDEERKAVPEVAKTPRSPKAPDPAVLGSGLDAVYTVEELDKVRPALSGLTFNDNQNLDNFSRARQQARTIAARWQVSEADLDELQRVLGSAGGSRSGSFGDRRESLLRAQFLGWQGAGGGAVATTAIASLLGTENGFNSQERDFLRDVRANPAARRAVELLARTVYDNTQEWFRERGVTHVRAFRGTPGVEGDRGRPWTSWSLSPAGTSPEFYLGNDIEGPEAAQYERRDVRVRDIPVAEVFSIPPSGFGTYHEQELVVLRTPPVAKTPRKRAPKAAGAGRAPATPTPAHDLFDADDATVETALRDVFEGQFGPYTTKVTVSRRRPGTDKRGRPVEPSISIEGKIYDADGTEIGYFGRSIKPVEWHYADGTVRREIWAEHSIVQLGGGDYDENPTKYHGTGFGGELNRRAIEWYRASGVHGIGQSDHNGYVWASQGFNFGQGGKVPDYLADNIRTLIADLRAGRTTSEATKDKYHTIPKRFRDAPDLQAQLAAAEALLARIASTKPGDPNYPTAYEISQLGRRKGQRGKNALWLGKLLFVSADEMILNPDEGEVISS